LLWLFLYAAKKGENMKKHILIAISAFVLGFAGNRLGQNVVVSNYNTCMEEGLTSIKSLEDLFALQKDCMPNALVRKLLFW
jgi:hypothetical protein